MYFKLLVNFISCFKSWYCNLMGYHKITFIFVINMVDLIEIGVYV